MGRLGAPFGVRGDVHVQSYTDPAVNFLDYQPRLLADAGGGWQHLTLTDLRPHKGQFLARVQGFPEREDVAALRGRLVAVPAAVLPPLAPDECYWRDLIDAEVTNQDGVVLGNVVGLLETGAHDVLRVRGPKAERLIPFVSRFVVSVLREPGQQKVRRVCVDWSETWEV